MGEERMKVMEDYHRTVGLIERRLREKGHRGVDAEGAYLLYRLGSRTLALHELDGDAYFGPSVQYAVKKLVAAKLLSQRLDPEDRRRKLVTASPRAAPIVKIIEEMERDRGEPTGALDPDARGA